MFCPSKQRLFSNGTTVTYKLTTMDGSRDRKFRSIQRQPLSKVTNNNTIPRAMREKRPKLYPLNNKHHPHSQLYTGHSHKVHTPAHPPHRRKQRFPQSPLWGRSLHSQLTPGPVPIWQLSTSPKWGKETKKFMQTLGPNHTGLTSCIAAWKITNYAICSMVCYLLTLIHF